MSFLGTYVPITFEQTTYRKVRDAGRTLCFSVCSHLPRQPYVPSRHSIPVLPPALREAVGGTAGGRKDRPPLAFSAPLRGWGFGERSWWYPSIWMGLPAPPRSRKSTWRVFPRPKRLRKLTRISRLSPSERKRKRNERTLKNLKALTFPYSFSIPRIIANPSSMLGTPSHGLTNILGGKFWGFTSPCVRGPLYCFGGIGEVDDVSA